MKFKQWLENNGMLEASPEEVNDAQTMWNLCHELLPYYQGDMNRALADYCVHMSEMQPPDIVGKTLGIGLVHAGHYKKLAAPVDRNTVFQRLKEISPEKSQPIIQAALRAYATYEMRPLTKHTITSLG